MIEKVIADLKTKYPKSFEDLCVWQRAAMVARQEEIVGDDKEIFTPMIEESMIEQLVGMGYSVAPYSLMGYFDGRGFFPSIGWEDFKFYYKFVDTDKVGNFSTRVAAEREMMEALLTVNESRF